MLYALPAVLLYLVVARRLGGAFTMGGAVKG
jgi:multiple sugar transport system permease protein